MAAKISRRKFVKGIAVTTAGAILAACKPEIVKETVIVEKPVEKIVKEIVKETVIVEGTPQVVEKVVEKVVTTTPVPMELVEITFARGEHVAQPLIQDAPAREALKEAAGVYLKLMPTPSADFKTKRNMLLATNQVPDMMRIGSGIGTIMDYADPSVLTSLMPLIDQYAPNVKKYVEAMSYMPRYFLGGALYALPCETYNLKVQAPMPMVRKDLLEKLGLPAPEDFDQLYEVLKAFKNANPDAVCWACRRKIKGFLMLLAYPMGSGCGSWYNSQDVPYFDKDVDGGKWLYGPIHPEFRDVLEYVAKLYKEGLIDPDIASTTSDDYHLRNSTDATIFEWENMTHAVRWNLALREKNPEAGWAIIPTLEGKKGPRQNHYTRPCDSVVIGAGCKHPERVIQLLDFQLSPEGLDLTNWGIEGVHYTLKAPRPDAIEDYTREGVSEAMYPEMHELVPAVREKYGKTEDPFRKFQSEVGLGQLDWPMYHDQAIHYLWDEPGEMDAWYRTTATDPGLHEEVLLPPFKKEEAERIKEIRADVDAIADPALDKVVLGLMSLSEYDNAVQEMIQAGAEDLEKIYNEAEARL